MARPKRKPESKQYRVKEAFRGHINDKQYVHKKGDIVEWNDTEYKIYSRFVEEITK